MTAIGVAVGVDAALKLYPDDASFKWLAPRLKRESAV